MVSITGYSCQGLFGAGFSDVFVYSSAGEDQLAAYSPKGREGFRFKRKWPRCETRPFLTPKPALEKRALFWGKTYLKRRLACNRFPRSQRNCRGVSESLRGRAVATAAEAERIEFLDPPSVRRENARSVMSARSGHSASLTLGPSEVVEHSVYFGP
jgi:hypothetical protein